MCISISGVVAIRRLFAIIYLLLLLGQDSIIYMKKTFEVIPTLKHAWKLFLEHKRFYLKTVLVFGLITVAADMLTNKQDPHLVDHVLSLVSMVASWYGSMILMRASLAITAGKPITDDVSRLNSSLILSLVGASILVGLGVFVGFVLLIIPGIIFAVRAALTQYVILDTEQHAVPAIKKSAELTRGYFWSFIRLFLCIVLVFYNIYRFICCFFFFF